MVFLSACAPAQEAPSGVVPDAPIATWGWTPGQGADEALLEGELALIDGCVYVVSTGDVGGVRTLVVFPEALASWDAVSETLTFGESDYQMGDLVAAGGGWFAPADTAVIPAACELDAYGDAMHVQDTTLEPMSQRT